jgi:hypothetical protein
MPITPPHYPIIYVRGFAATMGEIEDTTATPYMGFNDGATKIRQNHKGDIVRFIFESPLLRLMKDEGYCDTYKNGAEIPAGDECDPKCVWIFRYYEQASKDLGSGKRQTIPEIAIDLRKLILRVRDHVCGNRAADRKKFRVHLVSHSMGGLICRCYLQNLCVNGTGDAQLNRELELSKRTSNDDGSVADEVHLIDKVFTYATPHNGIDVFGMNVPDLGILDKFHVDNFNRANMHAYLKLPGKHKPGADVSSLNDAFPTERFFSLVGTNYHDYGAFMNLSRKATGPMSDGLVMMENATVQGSPRAFVHRSHSGHFGIVNSEEGYQNLRRFLFGDVRVDAQLIADEITLPAAIQVLKDKKKKEIRASYHIETTARVRGSTCFLTERRFDQASAILRDYQDLLKDQKPVYLFTGYLMEKLRTKKASDDPALAFAVNVSIRVPMYEVENAFWFDDHFEGGSIFNETITFRVLPASTADGAKRVEYGFASEDGLGVATRPTKIVDFAEGGRGFEVRLGFAPGDANAPRPGFRGRLRLHTAKWNG